MKINLRDKAIRYNKTSPEALEIEGSWGGMAKIVTKTVLVDLSGGVAAGQVAAFFKDGWTLLGVTAIVTEKIVSGGNRTTLNVLKNATGLYAKTLSTLTLAKGTTCEMKDITNFTAPLHLVADDTLDFTVTGGSSGDTTAGKIRVTGIFLVCTPPTS